jgi:hypothetical protein
MNIVIRSNTLYVNNNAVLSGTPDELKAAYMEYRYGSKAVASSAAPTPSRKGLDMGKGELVALRNGKWAARHPEYNHPVFGNTMLMGSESACRRVLGLPLTTESKALAAKSLAEMKEKLGPLDNAPARLAAKDLEASYSAERAEYLAQTSLF